MNYILLFAFVLLSLCAVSTVIEGKSIASESKESLNQVEEHLKEQVGEEQPRCP